MNTVPRIDMIDTGANILALRKKNKMTVKDLQTALGFNNPQSIFKWQRGDALPSVDNLVILADLFNVTVSDILVIRK
ncbi:MAG: helix-turn-helix transcriptional regulator [Erysipelotrichaceae bacterium]|nr:helix-turn-helix transcriptional regulator [Erysipelotrichaceae bacterium]